MTYSETLAQFIQDLGRLVGGPLQFLLQWTLLIVWIAWWLVAVNWRRVWPVLAQGAWMPLALLLFISALVWSQLAPSTCTVLGIIHVPNVWWQLGAVALLFAVTLFCGWLQGAMGWTPAEVDLDPPSQVAHAGDHGNH